MKTEKITERYLQQSAQDDSNDNNKASISQAVIRKQYLQLRVIQSQSILIYVFMINKKRKSFFV